MNKRAWLTLHILFLLPGIAAAETPGEIFSRANEAYYQNRPKEAVELYQSLMDSGQVSGDLFYNLGNAYYRLGKIGYAILNYEKAMRLTPRDADLRANLSFVQKKRPDPLPPQPAWTAAVEKLLFWSGYLTLEEALIAFLVVFSFSWLFGIVGRLTAQSLARHLQLALLLISVVLGGTAWFKRYREISLHPVVTVEPEIPVFPTFLDSQTPLLSLNEGVVLSVLSRQEFKGEGAWLQIALPKGQKGWIREQAVREI